VLVDLTRCIGCRACENACLVRAGFGPLPTATMGYGAGDGKLSFHTRTFVDFRDGGTKPKQPVKRQCMHCLEPACVSVCPVAALEKTAAGPVVYHENICIGCRYCLLACPFSVPKYEWDNALMPRVAKCDFCADRQAKGQSPACVAACPTGTLKFGKRSDLLQEAKARLDSQPDRYTSIYGEDIVGGTSWIYLSDTTPEELGFPSGLPKEPLPALTWKAISKLPFVVIGVGLMLSAIVRWRTRDGTEQP
jgi:formate dehydrogenase iron-sulfur subunit